jgi:5-methylthioadenosine/S-adenosylhomocysteine deaminase
MKLASGIAPVPGMLRAGVTVGLGTDGAASNNNLNMFTEMASASLLHKVTIDGPDRAPGTDGAGHGHCARIGPACAGRRSAGSSRDAGPT